MKLTHNPPRVELRVLRDDDLEICEVKQTISAPTRAVLECTPCGLRTSGAFEEMQALYLEHEPHARSFRA